jgi:CheY-like chemotaxis protein/GAF domain-containing protein
MKNVLIVDDEETLLMIMVGRFEDYSDRFNVLTAGNGKEAVKILESETVDLVVTDLKMPEMDGIELIAYLSSKYPSIPVIAASAYCTPDIQEKLKGMGALQVMDKPVNFDLLAQGVLKGLEQSAEGGSLNCISLSSFLQIIEMEEKSCVLEVHGDVDQRGFFFMIHGEMYNAVCGDLKGEDAAYEMLIWENSELFLRNLPREKPEKIITKPLMSVVMEGLRRKDEARQQGPAAVADEKEEPQLSLADEMEEPQLSLADEMEEPQLSLADEPDDLLPLFDEPEPAPALDDDGTDNLDDVLGMFGEETEFAGLEEEAAEQEKRENVDFEQYSLPGKIFRTIHADLKSGEMLQTLIQRIMKNVPLDLVLLLGESMDKPGFFGIDDFIFGEIADSTDTVFSKRNSLVSSVLKRKSPAALNLSDSLPGSLEKELFGNYGMQSCLVVPMLNNGARPGVLVLAAKEADQFSNDAAELEWLASGLSLAVERSRLSFEFAKQRLALEATKKIGRVLVSKSINIEKVLSYMMVRVRMIMDVEAGSLYLKEKDHWRAAVCFNTEVDASKKLRSTIGEGIAGRVAAKRKEVIVNDPQKAAQYFGEYDEKIGFKTRSVLAVPLKARKKVIGVLEVLNKKDGGFVSDDKALLNTIAASLSVALISKINQKHATPKAA